MKLIGFYHSSFIQVPFLNLLATIADRGGGVRIRIGGNTQETASLVESLPNNAMIAKDQAVPGGSSRAVRPSFLSSTTTNS